MVLKIISGSASQLLASRIAEVLGGVLALCEFKRFPDGELYTRILERESEETAEVLVVQSILSDSDFFCLLQLLDAVEDVFPSAAVDVVIPYMGYARQDKRFERGEAISARVVARCVSSFRPRRVFVVNAHSPDALRFFEVATYEINAVPLLASALSSVENAVVVAPDEGATELAKALANATGFTWDVLQKRRISGSEVEIKHKSLDVDGKNVIIVDDIISTGGTIATATKILKSQNAKDVFVACIHGIFAQNAVLRMLKAGVRDIFATDTVPSAFSRVSVAPAIASALKEK